MNTKSLVWYYVINPDDNNEIVAGPERTIEKLQSSLAEGIDGDDIELEGDERDFEVVATVGYITATKKTKVKMTFLSNNSGTDQ